MYFSVDIICYENRTVFRERSPRKTVSFEEQVMSKDRYATILSPLKEAILFIILQMKCRSDIPQFLLGNIQPRDAFKFRPIASVRRSMMDYNLNYLGCQSRFILILGICGPKTVAYGCCTRTESGSQNLVD